VTGFATTRFLQPVTAHRGMREPHTWSLQYFQERDMFREPSYSEASSEQRAEYIRDFHDKFSELSGYSRNLHFSNRMESHNLGAFNPLTKRIDLNVNLLRDADPLQVMEIVMHES